MIGPLLLLFGLSAAVGAGALAVIDSIRHSNNR